MRPFQWKGLFERARSETATPGGLWRGPNAVIRRLAALRGRGAGDAGAAPETSSPHEAAETAPAKPARKRRLRLPGRAKRAAPATS